MDLENLKEFIENFNTIDETLLKTVNNKSNKNLIQILSSNNDMTHYPFYKYDISLPKDERKEYEYNKFRMLRDEVTDQYVATIFKEDSEGIPKNLCFFIQYCNDFIISYLKQNINNRIKFLFDNSKIDIKEHSKFYNYFDGTTVKKIEDKYYYNSSIENIVLKFKGGTLMNFYKKKLFSKFSGFKNIKIDDDGKTFQDKFKYSDTDMSLLIDSYNSVKFNFLYSVISKLLIESLYLISENLEDCLRKKREILENNIKIEFKEQYDSLKKHASISLSDLNFISIDLDNCSLEYKPQRDEGFFKSYNVMILEIKSIINIINYYIFNKDKTCDIPKLLDEIVKKIAEIKKYLMIDVNLLSDLVNSIDTIQHIYHNEFWSSVDGKLILDFRNFLKTFIELINLSNLYKLRNIYQEYKINNLKNNIFKALKI